MEARGSQPREAQPAWADSAGDEKERGSSPALPVMAPADSQPLDPSVAQPGLPLHFQMQPDNFLLPRLFPHTKGTQVSALLNGTVQTVDGKASKVGC